MISPTPDDATRSQAPARLPRLSTSVNVWNPGWLDWSWPTVVTVVLVLGFLLGTQPGRDAASRLVNSLGAPRLLGTAPEQERVLIVTSNPRKQANVMLTLSPRGLRPVVALKLSDIKTILSRPAPTIRLAVVDEQLANAAAIERLLRASLPSNRIVVLKASRGPEDIGPLLLNRL